jgi:hypothetical protein
MVSVHLCQDTGSYSHRSFLTDAAPPRYNGHVRDYLRHVRRYVNEQLDAVASVHVHNLQWQMTLHFIHMPCFELNEEMSPALPVPSGRTVVRRVGSV